MGTQKLFFKFICSYMHCTVASGGRVRLEIAQNMPQPSKPNLDTEELAKLGAQVCKSTYYSQKDNENENETWVILNTLN